jgi:hypothetical protein
MPSFQAGLLGIFKGVYYGFLTFVSVRKVFSSSIYAARLSFDP